MELKLKLLGTKILESLGDRKAGGGGWWIGGVVRTSASAEEPREGGPIWWKKKLSQKLFTCVHVFLVVPWQNSLKKSEEKKQTNLSVKKLRVILFDVYFHLVSFFTFDGRGIEFMPQEEKTIWWICYLPHQTISVQRRVTKSYHMCCFWESGVIMELTAAGPNC